MPQRLYNRQDILWLHGEADICWRGADMTGASVKSVLPRGSPLGNYVACGSLNAPRLGANADGGGTTGPISPSGASSRSTITGAWSLGKVPLRACRSTQAARTRLATGALARTRSMRIPRSL